MVLVLGLAFLVVKHIVQPPEQRVEGRNRFNRGAGAFSGGRRNGNNNQDQAVAVSTAMVSMGDIQIRIPALGTITPLATVTVRTQINGQLQKIAFKEGQLVKQGEFLADRSAAL